jgi:hypothetical protein
MSSSNGFPGIDVTLLDGNLGVALPPSTGDSVLIIGTAEDGPKNQPISITSTDQLTSIYGQFGQGNLVRGVYETLNATNAKVDVKAMRIGNGKPATLGIKEMGAYNSNALAYVSSTSNLSAAKASGINDATYAVSGMVTAFIDAVTLTSKYEGSRYNDFNIRLGTYNNVNSDNNGRNCVVIYNPFTRLESTYSINVYQSNDSGSQVHDVVELVDYINADSNLNPYITASYNDLNAQFEIVASGTAGGTQACIVDYTAGISGANDVPKLYDASSSY